MIIEFATDLLIIYMHRLVSFLEKPIGYKVRAIRNIQCTAINNSLYYYIYHAKSSGYMKHMQHRLSYSRLHRLFYFCCC